MKVTIIPQLAVAVTGFQSEELEWEDQARMKIAPKRHISDGNVVSLVLDIVKERPSMTMSPVSDV